MNRIKELRLRRNISQLKLAEELNVHQTAVSQWEQNRTTPESHLLPCIADFFGVSVDYLLNRTDSCAQETSLAVKIKELRKEKGLTQVQVSELLGISQSSVNAWEIGKSRPSSKHLPELAKLYNVSVGELYGEPYIVEPEHNTRAEGCEEEHPSNCPLSKQEQDILRIYNSVDGRTQTQIMQFVYGLEETL